MTDSRQRRILEDRTDSTSQNVSLWSDRFARWPLTLRRLFDLEEIGPYPIQSGEDSFWRGVQRPRSGFSFFFSFSPRVQILLIRGSLVGRKNASFSFTDSRAAPLIDIYEAVVIRQFLPLVFSRSIGEWHSHALYTSSQRSLDR